MADFNAAYARTMLAEGGYVLTNDPADKGKQTYAGISRRFHPTWAGWTFIDAGQTPPTEMVRDLYRAEFWSAIKGASITDQSAAESLYDLAVNASPKVAVKLAQIVVGVEPDGFIGPKTLFALNGTDARYFRLAFALARIARREAVVSKDRSQEKFLLGWIRRDLKGVA